MFSVRLKSDLEKLFNFSRNFSDRIQEQLVVYGFCFGY